MFNNTVVREYVWSSVVTFLAAFITAVYPLVNSGTISLTQAATFALAAVGVRAGFKAVLNLITTKFQTTSSVPKQ